MELIAVGIDKLRHYFCTRWKICTYHSLALAIIQPSLHCARFILGKDYLVFPFVLVHGNIIIRMCASQRNNCTKGYTEAKQIQCLKVKSLKYFLCLKQKGEIN